MKAEEHLRVRRSTLVSKRKVSPEVSSADIAQHLAEFQARGGKITQVPVGASGIVERNRKLI